MNDWHEAEQRVERAQELFAQQKWQEALEELRAAIAINPYNAAWYFNVGLTLDEMQRFTEAVDAYRRAVALSEANGDPEDIEGLYRMGMDLLRLGRFRAAIDALNRVEAADASFEPAYCGRIVAYTELGDHEKAEEMFYLAREYRDECPHCYANIAQSLRVRLLLDKAIYCWQRALDLDEAYPQAHEHLAEALREKGELEQARQHYLQELRLEPGNLRALLEMGELLMQMGRVEEAGEKLRRAIELSPREPATHQHYGRWLLHCGRPDAARQALARACSLNPRYPGTQLCLAELALIEGDIANARRHLRMELRLRRRSHRRYGGAGGDSPPPHSPISPSLLLAELGNLLIDVGQPRQAAACLKRLVQVQPHSIVAWQNLAVAYFMTRRFAEGIECCHQTLKLDPRQTTAMYNLALAHEQQGDYAAAKAWVRHGLRIDPHDLCLQRLDMRIRVLTAWRRLMAGLRKLLRPWGVASC